MRELFGIDLDSRFGNVVARVATVISSAKTHSLPYTTLTGGK